ncbi:unnamed protein product [Orchesella dallaii]
MKEMQGRSSDNDPIEKLFNEYYSLQESFFSEAKELAKAGASAAESCQMCNQVEGDMNTCIADCITKQIGSYQNLAENIADTVKSVFCKPLGMKMDKYFIGKEAKDNLMWRDYKMFANRLLRQQKSSVPLQNLVESWISNVNLLDESPMHIFSKIKTQIADLFTDNDMKMANPNMFASKCNSMDLSTGIATLVGAGKQKSYVMDVLLRGLHSVKSSLFYSFGPANPFGSFLEGLNTMVGTNCDLIAYAMDESSTNKCDSLGQFPNFQFPYARSMLHMAPKCAEEMAV